MANKDMTQKQALAIAIEALEGTGQDEAMGVLVKMLEQKSKPRERKANPEVEAFRMQVLEVLKGAEGPMTGKEVAGTLEVSVQKASAALRFLVEAGVAVKLEGEKSIPALGHNYKYNLDIANSSLAYSCQREGCAVSATETVTGYTVTSTVSATCAVPARTVYKVTTAAGTYENVVVDGKTLPHKLGGKDTESGSVHEYGTSGIKYFADSEIECGKTIRAYFNCEVCQGIVEVQVNKPDHNYSLDYSTLVKPDYKTAGSVHYKCTNADCKLFMNIVLPAVVTTGADKNATVTSAATELKGETAKYTYTEPIFDVKIEIADVISAPKLEHSYSEYVLEGGEIAKGTTVKATCSNAGCPKPEINSKIAEATITDSYAATCKGPAGVTYDILLENGDRIKLDRSLGTTVGDHQINGQDGSSFKNSDGTYYDSVTGIKIFGGTKLNCDETASGYYTCTACKGVVQVTVKGEHSYTVKDITVPTTETTGTATLYCGECKTSESITLGKIVLTGEGANAKKVNETSAAIVYDYTYKINADDKVVVRITVPKTAA